MKQAEVQPKKAEMGGRRKKPAKDLPGLRRVHSDLVMYCHFFAVLLSSFTEWTLWAIRLRGAQALRLRRYLAK